MEHFLCWGLRCFKKSGPSGVQVIRDYPHKVRQVVTIFATKKKPPTLHWVLVV